uniref:Putative secreted protein n=1 Tax=Desmodus rotundus TaxID=9430 RepID=K9IY47_DESRO
MSSVWALWTLLLCLGPDCYWPFHWWELPSGWRTSDVQPPLCAVHCCVGAGRTKQTTQKPHHNKQPPNHHNVTNNKRARNNKSGKRNGRVENRGKEKEYEKTNGKKSDYEEKGEEN